MQNPGQFRDFEAVFLNIISVNRELGDFQKL